MGDFTSRYRGGPLQSMGCRGQPSPRHHGQHEHRFPSVRPVLPGRGGASLESVSSENLNPPPSLPWLPGSPARDSWPSGGTGPFLCLSECTCHLHACALPSPTSHVVSTASPVTSQRAKLQLLPRQREATAGKSRRDGALETPKARSQPQTRSVGSHPLSLGLHRACASFLPPRAL